MTSEVSVTSTELEILGDKLITVELYILELVTEETIKNKNN